MKLRSIKIENYRSIEDSTEFDIGDVTCLVGKNEAGKSALLSALHQLRPYGEEQKQYDKIVDYPRRFKSNYKDRHKDSEARVCFTKWEITPEEKAVLEVEFGPNCLKSNEVTISKYYESKGTTWHVQLNEKSILDYLIQKYRLDAIESAPLKECYQTQKAHEILNALPERSDKQDSLLAKISTYRDKWALLKTVDILDKSTPKFKLFSHFDRMSGQISVEQVIQDRNSGVITRGDSIFLQFLEYAGTDLSELAEASRYEELKSECESASNRLTDQIFKYWTQNTALEVEVDVSPGRPGDPIPFNTGTVVRARVRNSYHRASVPFSERSAGFVWFFSFLVEFTQIKKKMEMLLYC
jgi:predicted ATP-dependent endonuclease of OLD family